MSDYIRWLDEIGMADLDAAGGKGASLGEMIRHLGALGIRVPGGFTTTALAYRAHLAQNGLAARIDERLAGLDIEDTAALSAAGREIREWIAATPFPAEVQAAITAAWAAFCEREGAPPVVAVRSSATAEDLPTASFAGQQETFLNVSGRDAVLRAIGQVFASLYNDRAIAYRVHHGFAHADVALAAIVQRMVRSDLGASGVVFTLDTESGFSNVVLITAAWGLGEAVVQGAVNPDEIVLYKPNLKAGRPAIVRRNLGAKNLRMVYDDQGGVRTEPVPEALRRRFALDDETAHELARQALAIETHYGRPMDVEWALDGDNGRLYILQARPETVKGRNQGVIERYTLLESSDRILARGRSIGQRIGQGTARVITGPQDMHQLAAGEVLITDMTDPDWEPVMKRAAAIVTNRGGRTCHAAIIARELGIPAVVGCGDATATIAAGTPVTVSCAEGETGLIYAGLVRFERQTSRLDELPAPPLKIMMNVGNPDRAFDFAQIPNHGVGLARLEFIINRMIGIHPRALLEYRRQDEATRRAIDEAAAAYPDPVSFYIARLTEGIATIAAAFAPQPVIVRLSDFKSNEYANLLGGARYEPDEENPMLGFRGAGRYIDPGFKPCFELECRALKKVREEMGLGNVWAMVPFVRTVAEGAEVLAVMREFGLERGLNDLKIIMMCEIPSNALQADAFLEHFDGMSIGSNDLTQLTLGLDRDSGLVAERFDETDPAVKALMSMAIRACRARGKYIGICGQGPSDHPELARWLLAEGIESLSLNPDTVVKTWLDLAGL